MAVCMCVCVLVCVCVRACMCACVYMHKLHLNSGHLSNEDNAPQLPGASPMRTHVYMYSA